MPKKAAPAKKRAAKAAPKSKLSPKAPAPPAFQPSHQVFPADDERKWQLLFKLLRSGGILPSLVFVNSKSSLENLERVLERGGLKAERLGSMKEKEADFPLDRVPILLGTDQDAAACTIKGARRVFNYEVPATLQEYNGRMRCLAFSGGTGAVMTLCTLKEHPVFEEIRKGLDAKVELVSLREFAPRELRPVPAATPAAPAPLPPTLVQPPSPSPATAPVASESALVSDSAQHPTSPQGGYVGASSAQRSQDFSGVPPLPSRAPALDLRPLDESVSQPLPHQRQVQAPRHQPPRKNQDANRQPQPPKDQAVAPVARLTQPSDKPRHGQQHPKQSQEGRRRHEGRPRPGGQGHPPSAPRRTQPNSARGQHRGGPGGREERPVSDVKDILRRAAAQKPYVTGRSSDLRPAKKDHGKYGTNW